MEPMRRNLIAILVAALLFGCADANARKLHELKASDISKIEITLFNAQPQATFVLPASDYPRFLELFGNPVDHPDAQKGCSEGHISIVKSTGDEISAGVLTMGNTPQAVIRFTSGPNVYYRIGSCAEVRTFLTDTYKAVTGKDAKLCGP